MNPAMNFGLNVANTAFDGDALWGYHYIDWVGPLLGAILATILFRYVFVFSSYILEENNKSPFWGMKVFLFFFFLVDTIRLLFASENRWIRLWKI